MRERYGKRRERERERERETARAGEGEAERRGEGSETVRRTERERMDASGKNETGRRRYGV